MPGIYVGTSEIKNIYVGTTPVKEVYVGTTKVRPSVTPITTSGIYRNQTDGLISLSSDGSTLRPFKNEPVQPREGDEWISLTNLKSLSELAAMSTVDAETELNKYPSYYYQKFNSEGKLVNISGYYYLTNDGTQSGLVERDNGYTLIGYKSDQNMWYAMPN